MQTTTSPTAIDKKDLKPFPEEISPDAPEEEREKHTEEQAQMSIAADSKFADLNHPSPEVAHAKANHEVVPNAGIMPDKV